MEKSAMEANCEENAKEAELVKSEKFTKAKIIRNLVLVSFTFLISFTASEGLAFLQSTMNKEVGVISFAVQYACGCIAALFLPKYLIQKFGSKLIMVISMFAYVPYLASNFYPVFGFMMPTSILVGFASSLVFNSLATYVNDLASMYTELCLKKESQNLNKDLPQEKEVLKNNFRDSPQFYNSLRKHKDSIFITKQSLFGEGEEFSNEAVTTDKEIALIEFKQGSPLCERMSKTNPEKSNLIPENANKQENNDILTGKIQNILKESYGSVKNRTSSSPINSSNLKNSSFFNKNELKLEGKKKVFDSGISSLGSVPEGVLEPGSDEGIEPKSEVEDRQKESFGVTPFSEEAIKVLETTTSRFFGFFGCVYQACHILSNVITYFIFQKTSLHRDYDQNSSCVCGSEFCSMDSACILHNLEMPSTETRYTLTTVYVVMSFLSALLTLLFLSNLNKKNEKVSFSFEMAIMTLKFHKNKNQLLLIPLSVAIGISQAFVTGDFTKDFIGCAWGVEHVALVALSMGISISSFSGLYCLLEKHVGRYVFFGVAATLSYAVNIIMLFWTPDATEPIMMYVVGGMWGAIIGIMWCQLRAFIGLIFKDEEETGFGCYQLWHALGCAIVYAYNNYVCTYVKIYIILAAYTLATIGYLLAERNYSLSKKQNSAS